MPQVNTGSLDRCGKRTYEQPVGYGRRRGAEIRPKRFSQAGLADALVKIYSMDTEAKAAMSMVGIECCSERVWAITVLRMRARAHWQGTEVTCACSVPAQAGRKLVFAEHDKVQQFEKILSLIVEKATQGVA